VDVLQYITTEKAVHILRELVQTASISKTEQLLAEKIRDRGLAMGFEAYIDRHGNAIISRRYAQSGVKLLLNAHMDTVDVGESWTKDPFGAEINGNIMYGLGTSDCKGSIAAMLLALEAIAQSGIELTGEIFFSGVVQEEVQNVASKGTVKLIRDGLAADVAIVGEPSCLTICLGCEGMVEVEVTTEGVPAHGSNPEKGVNAIVNMAKLIDEVVKVQPGHSDLLGSGSINIGVIQGGLRSSVVPDLCKLKIGRFVVEGETGAAFLQEVDAILHRLKQQDSSFIGTALLTYDSSAGVIPEKTPVVGILKQVTSEVLGEQAPLTGTRAHLDSDFLINLAKIPTVTFGPGDMTRAHQADEYIEIEDVAAAAKVYAKTIIRLLAV
jgi:acetylornithine deacetylase/succinyl-diaminopimelate desuccinylase family protein